MDKAKEDAILACREFRCAWDHEPRFYRAEDRYGDPCLERRLGCLRGCGSERVDRVPTDDPYGPYKRRTYYRPPEWGSAGNLWFTTARAERIRKQLAGVGIK